MHSQGRSYPYTYPQSGSHEGFGDSSDASQDSPRESFGGWQQSRHRQRYPPHNRRHPREDVDEGHSEVVDEVLARSYALIDKAVDIREAERSLRRAHNLIHLGPAQSAGRYYGEHRSSALPVELRRSLENVKSPLIGELQALEADAKRYIQNYMVFLPAMDIFTSLPGDAGKIQDAVREARRELTEACCDTGMTGGFSPMAFMGAQGPMDPMGAMYPVGPTGFGGSMGAGSRSP